MLAANWFESANVKVKRSMHGVCRQAALELVQGVQVRAQLHGHSLAHRCTV